MSRLAPMNIPNPGIWIAIPAKLGNAPAQKRTPSQHNRSLRVQPSLWTFPSTPFGGLCESTKPSIPADLQRFIAGERKRRDVRSMN